MWGKKIVMFIELIGCVFLFFNVCVDLLGRKFWLFLEDNIEVFGFILFIRICKRILIILGINFCI